VISGLIYFIIRFKVYYVMCLALIVVLLYDFSKLKQYFKSKGENNSDVVLDNLPLRLFGFSAAAKRIKSAQIADYKFKTVYAALMIIGKKYWR